jgi:hypothetical protein
VISSLNTVFLNTILSTVCRVFLSAVAACLISLSLIAVSQPSYAASQPAANQPAAQNSAETQQREQAYEEAKGIAEDPKMGIEKEYEKEVEVYREEHADESGIVEKAKELMTEVTGK